MRIIRKRKLNNHRVFLTIAMLLLTLIIIGHSLKPSSLKAYEPITYEPVKIVTVNVNKGDSLWKIAGIYSNNKMDLKVYINIIQQYNNLSNTIIQPGQELEVPIY